MDFTTAEGIVILVIVIFIFWLVYRIGRGAVNGIRNEFSSEARLKSEEEIFEYHIRRDYYEPPHMKNRNRRRYKYKNDPYHERTRK